MSIKVEAQSNYAFRQDLFFVRATVTAGTEPCEEIWLSLLNGAGCIVEGTLRREAWSPSGGTQTFDWREKWFKDQKPGRGFKFIVAIVSKGAPVMQSESALIDLQGLGIQ
ncbi:hypothetical protein SAMD00023353_5700520 [Rosellinia necatrix]|uniref:Uncharacterized protein n=1 Tax=Rosellinia necatrix TaxID=77044 RepID=A0A1S8AA77_ROSNE|nr:hypothetical protein SAMD00023353_5700520 [Rosellinia necatrix]